MNVVFIGWDDHTCVCQGFADAMKKHLRWNVRTIVERRHPLGIRVQDIVLRDPLSWNPIVLGSLDWILCTDSMYDRCDSMLARLGLPPLTKQNYPKHRLGTVHVGTVYRENAEHYNIEDKKRGFDLRVVARDLKRFAPDAKTFVQAVEPGRFPQPGDPIVITHAANNPRVRHSDKIRAAVESHPIVKYGRAESRFVPPSTLYYLAMKIRNSETIYVDHINPTFGGMGQGAVEAMAHGAVPVGDYRFLDSGDIDPWVSTDVDGLVDGIITADEYWLRKQAWWWAYDNARPEIVAGRWKEWLE